MSYNKVMKSFKIKFKPLIWVLLLTVLGFSLAGCAWNIYNVIVYLPINTIKTVTSAIMCLLCLILTAVSLSIAVFSKYTVDGKNLTVCFGVIKTKLAITEIKEVCHFKKSDKLVVYSLDDKYTVIIIPPSEYDNFVLALREYNKSIVFDVRIDGEDTPE